MNLEYSLLNPNFRWKTVSILCTILSRRVFKPCKMFTKISTVTYHQKGVYRIELIISVIFIATYTFDPVRDYFFHYHNTESNTKWSNC